MEPLAVSRRRFRCLIWTSRPHLTDLSLALNTALRLHHLLA